MERGTAGRRPTSPLLKFDLTVQQRFGVSVGRLVFAVTCCYYQADDCNHNHKHLIVAHEHHLPISTFEESERNPPRYPIMNIWEVEPSTVSRQCHLHHCIDTTTYQEFSPDFGFTWSRHLPQEPQPLHLPQMRQVIQIGYRFNHAHLTHHAYQPTTLTKLTIATKR